jgi:hypothetical protein
VPWPWNPWLWPLLLPRFSHCGRDRLTSQTRDVRGVVPRRALHASRDAPYHSSAQPPLLGGLPPPHGVFQAHAAHLVEWSTTLHSKGAAGPCLPEGVATCFHAAFTAHSGSDVGDWVGRGRGSLLLFPRPPTEPCGTVSVLHGSPVGTMRRFRITGLTPPSPAIVLHLLPFAMWLAFPAPDSYDHSVTLELSSRRPIPQCTPATRLSVREAVHACLPRPHWAVLDAQRSLRPSADLGDESTLLSDAVADAISRRPASACSARDALLDCVEPCFPRRCPQKKEVIPETVPARVREAPGVINSHR